MPPLPDGHTIFVLAITALALFLFTRDRLPLEASSLAILVILILSSSYSRTSPTARWSGPSTSCLDSATRR